MSYKRTVLVVDDNKTNLAAIKNILEERYNVLLAISGQIALKFVEKKKPDIVLLDIMMPGMDGWETYREIKKKDFYDEISTIFLTADQNPETEAKCLKMGAADFITKPIVPEVVLRRIEKTLELNEFRRYMERAVSEKQRELETVSLQAISAIANTIDAKDEDTNGHSIRVADYSRRIAKRMGFSDEDAENVYRAALLHDVGKISIPDNILKKAGRLTDEEYTLIKNHTTAGAEILSAFQTLPYIAAGARYHHERFDGKGYPQGLAGEDIPVIGRILAVADVYDALTSRRCYKEGMAQSDVLHELERNAGTQFDPNIVRIFIQLMTENEM